MELIKHNFMLTLINLSDSVLLLEFSVKRLKLLLQIVKRTLDLTIGLKYQNGNEITLHLL